MYKDVNCSTVFMFEKKLNLMILLTSVAFVQFIRKVFGTDVLTQIIYCIKILWCVEANLWPIRSHCITLG